MSGNGESSGSDKDARWTFSTTSAGVDVIRVTPKGEVMLNDDGQSRDTGVRMPTPIGTEPYYVFEVMRELARALVNRSVPSAAPAGDKHGELDKLLDELGCYEEGSTRTVGANEERECREDIQRVRKQIHALIAPSAASSSELPCCNQFDTCGVFNCVPRLKHQLKKTAFALYDLRASLSHATTSVPEGWKLVPIVATPEMIRHVHDGPLGAGGEDMDQKTANWLREMWAGFIERCPNG